MRLTKLNYKTRRASQYIRTIFFHYINGHRSFPFRSLYSVQRMEYIQIFQSYILFLFVNVLKNIESSRRRTGILLKP